MARRFSALSGKPFPPAKMASMVSMEKWDPKKDGLFTEQAMRKKLERRGFSVSRYVYPPGASFPPHTHPVDKIDAVLSGRFRMTLQGVEAILEAGDSIFVPRNTLHSAEVVGSESVVSLDATKD